MSLAVNTTFASVAMFKALPFHENILSFAIGTADEDRCLSLYPVGNCIQVSEHWGNSCVRVVGNSKIH